MSKPHKPRYKGTSKAKSAAVFTATVARMKKTPVTVQGVIMANKVTVIQPAQFCKLNVDERYQRLRITESVNDIIHALRSGGQVLDAIHVVERADGSWWIVDGQQRFWAHDECGLPLRAMIHKVPDIETETKLFLALNNSQKISARTIVKGWPGPAGDVIRWAANDPTSPVFELVDVAQNSHLPVDAGPLAKSLLAVTTGLIPDGNISTRLLPRLDYALKQDPDRVQWCKEYVRLVAAVFDMSRGGNRVRVLPMVALARVAYRKWTEMQRPTFPSTCRYLRSCNWNTVVPSHASRFLPVLESEVEKRWRT